ncbi:hypothetical protein NP233_g1298 [Leucocoprinus birnbaumii]|uniref:Mechanosensitive ion channel protein n=1 Tax=Leucocoprinus birnbaumii TaxID=56174 RepID=A0AAD5YUZ4_9AGAR|nr:hypothetical protein NP233_g1298 [Leucocoprinus birnbaumii]
MESQNQSQSRPKGLRLRNARGESVDSTSKHVSNSTDLEKGEIIEEDKTAGIPTLQSQASMDDVGRDSKDKNKQVMRKHWVGTKKGRAELNHIVVLMTCRPSPAWFILVFLGLGACWIPAILAWTKFPGAKVWGVDLLFWSIWLSILWAGWWFALVFSLIYHQFLLLFVNVFNIWRLKRYVNWLEYLHGYLALVAWSAALWITWVPLIAEHQAGNGASNDRSVRAVNLGGKILFALACCAAILFAEKVAVQWIAMKFHERSYQRRIIAQKDAVRAFKVLFSLVDQRKSGPLFQSGNSKGRFHRQWPTNTYTSLSDNQRFNYYHYLIDRSPTSRLQTPFADVTGQIFGTSQLDKNDVIGKAFHRNGSKNMQELAEYLWRSLVDQPAGSITQEQIAMRRNNVEDQTQSSTKGQKSMTTKEIWNVLTNGLPHLELIREEDFKRRCSELHAEQRRLEETMSDLQNVVGRLDDLLMLFWIGASVLIFAVALEAELKTLIFGAGSAFVGASWLLKDTATEILASIIFLFSKHPFDVEDKVIIGGKKYTVVEMRLLSTVFHDDESVQVQAPNSILNTMFIQNLRRSPATSEPFTIEVSDRTTQEQLLKFRSYMIEFFKEHPEDYRDDFEVVIQELSHRSQEMTLSMEIKYNNNWESRADVRARRRNEWICQVRKALKDARILGPGTPSMRITADTSDEEAS